MSDLESFEATLKNSISMREAWAIRDEWAKRAQSEIDRLTRELAEAKTRAIPDGCIAVNREKLERIADAIFSKRYNAQENGDAYDVGYFGKMLEDLEAMLSARPEYLPNDLPNKETLDVE